MIQTDKILFIPSLRKGNGTGHLKRCLDWGEDFVTMHILILQNTEEELFDFKNHPLCSGRKNIKWYEKTDTEWELIVLDNRSTDSIPDYLKNYPLMVLDESGKIRDNASYVMDSLPSLSKQIMNSKGFRFLKRKTSTANPKSQKRILISFGGEDSTGLALRVLDSLKSEKLSSFIIKNDIKIDLVIPSLGGINLNQAVNNIRILPYITNLSDKLNNYDLIICQYGMTAFEALSCSRFVFLLNPGTYHDKLSKAAAIPYFPDALSLNKEKLTSLLLDQFSNNNQDIELKKKTHYKLWKIFSQKYEKAGPWIRSMTISSNVCPVCGSSERSTIGRFENKSYFRCTECFMKYMIQFRIKKDIYSKDYFFSDYKNQYGKTYIEDFPHIQEMARKRLNRIKRVNPEPGELLDIGCAYGPFLLTALEAGYTAKGLEISEDAVNYIRENFKNIKIQQGDLNSKTTRNLFYEKQFQVITLWYVIEHFSDLSIILPYLGTLLKEGGILAMATPCASGVSGRFNSYKFYKNSPEDHYTIWDKKSAVKSLRNAGLKKIHFVSTGHHPERFPAGLKKILPGFVRMFISKIMGWGDTFEIYAQKG